MRRLALLAEDGGLDSVWAADHLFYHPPEGPRRGMWECWTVLSAIAEATQRVEIGPLVLCTPFRNPGLLAWMANTIDEVSGGRFVLGLGSGWHEPEFSAFSFEFERRVSLFADSLAVLAPLLREGRVDHDGRFASGHAELHPRGPREKGPPILISAVRPRMMALAAQWADRFNTVWYGRPNDAYRTDVTNLEQACETRQRDPGEIEVSAGVAVIDEQTAAQRSDRDFLTGSADEIADGLAAWREEGVAEVMCRLEPSSPEMVERVIRVAENIRAG